MEITAKSRLSGVGLYNIFRLVKRTCRHQVIGLERFMGAYNSGKPLVFHIWHGQQMMFVPFALKYVDVNEFVCITPDDSRGATLSTFANHLGATPFAMDLYGDKTMSQGRQLVKLVRMVMEGNHLAIAPDGPDGPAYKAKPGFTYVAQKANAILLPVGSYCRNGYIIPRWDQYVIPYPFSRVSIHVGDPYVIPEDVKDLSEIEEYLTDQLNRVTMQAAANYYERGSKK